MPCSNIWISTSEAIMHRRRMITDYTDIIPITSIRSAAHGETITRRTFRLPTGGATEKRAQAGRDCGSINNRLRLSSLLIGLSTHSIQNHSRQVHALGHHGGETRRRAAYIRVPRQTNGRYDRGGNDQRRLHSRLLLHLLRPSLPLPRNRSLHFTHQCTTDRTGLGPSLYESFPRKISEGR